MKTGGVLLVDDSVDDATFVQMAFKSRNLEHALLVVSSGLEAMQYLSHQGSYTDQERFPLPGLMLLDLRMPVIDGFEVLRWVRGHEGLQMLPITVLTGSEFPQDRKRAYELGANSFLVKPTRLEDFFSMIKAVIDFWLKCCKLPGTPDW